MAGVHIACTNHCIKNTENRSGADINSLTTSLVIHPSADFLRSPSVRSATHYTALTVLPSVLQAVSLPPPLVFSQPSGLPAIAPPVHQHRGQEGGIYADIWTGVPTTPRGPCQRTAGLQPAARTHTLIQNSAHSVRMLRKLD